MASQRIVVRNTASVCPVCFRKLPAALLRKEDEPGIVLERTCPAHGVFSDPVWRDRVDFDLWVQNEERTSGWGEPAAECGGDCYACGGHPQGTCCVLLEVTKRCGLHCRFCFADGGGEGPEDPSPETLFGAIDDITAKAPGILLQFSGGEPTLREDLPELIARAKKAGCLFTQVNTNGIRLAEDEAYVRRLSEAGMDICFLQFDGVRREICEKLRGRDLLEKKLAAIRNCWKYNIGVTLVPTVVRGINDQDLGDIVRAAVQLSPAVRGVHFQPVTYMGRTPDEAADRYTLDELISDLCAQTGLPFESLLPSRCDHALCGFHGTYLIGPDHTVTPVTDQKNILKKKGHTSAEGNRRFVGSHWKGTGAGAKEKSLPETIRFSGPLAIRERLEAMDLSELAGQLKRRTLTLSAMAFQDAGNMNLERLARCSLHVYDRGRLVPFCARYMKGGTKSPSP